MFSRHPALLGADEESHAFWDRGRGREMGTRATFAAITRCVLTHRGPESTISRFYSRAVAPSLFERLDETQLDVVCPHSAHIYRRAYLCTRHC